MRIPRGTLIAGRYRVESTLGKGGMGEVYAAENTRTGRRVAVKVLRAESRHKASAIERFRREARAAGAIRSEFVTQVLDVEDDEEHGIVLVFELLEGESLVERLKRTGPVAMPELWGIVEAVWAGLADAHAAGIIHRDLKPSNVYLEPRGALTWVKLLDFGISKLPKEFGSDSLTQLGQSLGTFSFMPPEQIGRAKVVDHRADIYACATLVFQALTGKLPFSGKNSLAMMELKAKSPPMKLSEALGRPVDPALEAFVDRGLARLPEERFQTALEALEAWRGLRPPGAVSIVERYHGTSSDVPEAMPPADEGRGTPAPPRARSQTETVRLSHDDLLSAPSSEGATLVKLPPRLERVVRGTQPQPEPRSQAGDARAREAGVEPSNTIRIEPGELERWASEHALPATDATSKPAAAGRPMLMTTPLHEPSRAESLAASSPRAGANPISDAVGARGAAPAPGRELAASAAGETLGSWRGWRLALAAAALVGLGFGIVTLVRTLLD